MAKLRYLDKIPEPPSPAMQRGIEIHKKAEDYIKGVLKRLPKELVSFHKQFKKLRDIYSKCNKKDAYKISIEDNWAFTSTWSQTQWNDWVNCWVRMKLDCAYQTKDGTLDIYDWKTGKFRPDNQEDYIEQVELFALGAFLMYGHIDIVKPKLIYVDQGIVYPILGSLEEAELTFKREDLGKLKGIWTKRTGPMMRDRKFAPRPNNFCSWCHFRKSNKADGGGQCKY